MVVAILGTGVVGRTLAEKIASLGHDVMVGTRDPDAALARDDGALAGWIEETPGATLRPFADAAAAGDIVFNATSGEATLDALAAAGAENLAGKVLIDVTNPLDFSEGFPPRLSIANDDSLAEQIQRAFPAARVVKTLNTVTAPLMVDPSLAGDGEHHVFVCGNDADAKDRVTAILREWFGWRNILDIGDITSARGTEMYLALWTRTFRALGTTMFNMRVVT